MLAKIDFRFFVVTEEHACVHHYSVRV
jgi:hypothetical protein